MKAFKIIPLLLFLIFIMSCKDEPEEEEPKIAISGITERDGNGELTGNNDPADWNLNTTFNSMENKLFRSDDLAICADAEDSIYNVQVYPNPNDGVFNFETIIPNESISVRIVDDQLDVLFSKDSITGGTLTISENGDGGTRKVRLYYRVYNGACKYQGYGDIFIR